MAGPQYIKFHHADWYAATRDLDDHEYACYMRILVDMWMEGEPILNEKVIPRRIFKTPDEWADIREGIAQFFKISENGDWYHDRVDGDLTEAFDLIAKNSKAGKASALARRAKKRAEEKKAKTKKNIGKTDSYNVDSTCVETSVSAFVEASALTTASTTREDKTKLNNTTQHKNNEIHRMTTVWMPHKSVALKLNNELDIPMTFIWPLVPEFRMYWIERGQMRSAEAWERTFYNRVQKIWESEGGNNKHRYKA